MIFHFSEVTYFFLDAPWVNLPNDVLHASVTLLENEIKINFEFRDKLKFGQDAMGKKWGTFFW
jgi:hypothetical protein